MSCIDFYLLLAVCGYWSRLVGIPQAKRSIGQKFEEFNRFKLNKIFSYLQVFA
jgi:hypothetical protein